MKRLLVVLALASLAGCIGTVKMPGDGKKGSGGGSGSSGGGSGGGGQACAQNDDDRIRLGLQNACIGCHSAGNKPFFTSLEAFENGLVWNPQYVKPGDPEGSYLIQLLEGHGTGTYPQMPTNMKYDDAVAAGLSTIPLDALKQWITALPPAPTSDPQPSPNAFTVRRLTAEEMVTSLMDQLGLTLADFVATGDPNWQNQEYTFNGGALGVWPVDTAPGISNQYVSDARAGERFLALGGPNTLNSRKRDTTLAPSSVETLVQVSQAWCSLAIDKANNPAVLKTVTLADTSATNADGIKQNIAALHLRMLGTPATQSEIDTLYTDLYLPFEATNTHVAWVAVCASFVRHPQWLTF